MGSCDSEGCADGGLVTVKGVPMGSCDSEGCADGVL